MRRLTIFLVFALLATFCIERQSLAETTNKPGKEASQGEKPKPEDLLKQMADYLGGLPAFACRIESSLDIKAEGQDPMQEVTKMTARLERPNRLALIVDEGKMGLTIVSDGKQLTQFLPVLNRYAVNEAPGNFAPMNDVGVPLKPTILGAQTWLIPTGGDDYYKQLVANVESSKYLGTEKAGGVLCHHLRFIEKRFDWDVWIEDGKRPVVEKVLVDLSKQFADEKATITYTVTFSDWNVAPKFKEGDFTFKPPATAEQVDQLIEPEPPHPLLGKPAPEFKTVDLDGHPFDLKSKLGKDVIMLDFWSTSCGPCVMLMPDLEAVAKKFADRGVVYRAINGGEDAESIKAFLEATKIKAPIVLDQELEIWRSYRVEPIPQTVLIGKDGKVQVVHLGYSEALAGEITKEIEALLAGKDLAAEELGKRKKSQKQPK
jgi:thiol-disulfide isomerase/thioredoxin